MTCGICSGQTNLVPNPSFEDTVHCPGGLPYGISILNTTEWWRAAVSPDYYNACANSTYPSAGVPSNTYVGGFQNAYDGNAYAGFAIFGGTVLYSIREYIEVQLIQPLTIGTKYYVSGYISRADSVPCSSNNFGYRFSNIQYTYTSPLVADNFSHIYSNSIITDSINWTRIAGSFIADSAYSYLLVGNFFDNAHTNTIHCPSNPLAYYFVDAICVSTDSLYCLTTESINEEPLIDYSIYPNPFTDKLNFQTHNYEQLEIIIYDITSRKLLQQTFTNTTTLNTEQLAKGMYLYTVRNKNGIIKNGKVIKQ